MLVRGAHGLAGAGLLGAGALGQGVMRCSCGCFRTVGRRRAQASRDATRLLAVLPLLKRRIEISLAPDQEIETFDNHRGKFELKLPRDGFHAEADIRSACCNGQRKIRLGSFDPRNQVQIAPF